MDNLECERRIDAELLAARHGAWFSDRPIRAKDEDALKESRTLTTWPAFAEVVESVRAREACLRDTLTRSIRRQLPFTRGVVDGKLCW